VKAHRILLEQHAIDKSVHIKGAHGTDITIEYGELQALGSKEDVAKYLHSRARAVSNLINKKPAK
jgi:hypothetical protein